MTLLNRNNRSLWGDQSQHDKARFFIFFSTSVDFFFSGAPRWNKPSNYIWAYPSQVVALFFTWALFRLSFLFLFHWIMGSEELGTAYVFFCACVLWVRISIFNQSFHVQFESSVPWTIRLPLSCHAQCERILTLISEKYCEISGKLLICYYCVMCDCM